MLIVKVIKRHLFFLVAGCHVSVVGRQLVIVGVGKF
jgi:hypothetical protein